MVVLDAGLDGNIENMVFLYGGSVVVFDDLVACVRAELVGFLLFVRAADRGRRK